MLVFGCDADPVVEEPGSAIRLVSSDEHGRVSPPNEASTAQEVFLNPIQTSREDLFLIINNSGQPVRDIELTLEGAPEGITVVPERIAYLMPSSMEPSTAYIKLQIQHGIRLADASPALAIERGAFTFTLRLSGSQGDGASSKQVTTDVSFQAVSQLSDVEFADDRGALVLPLPFEGRQRRHLAWRINEAMHLLQHVGPLHVTNTGDTKVMVEFLADPFEARWVLEPSQTVQIMDTRNTGWIRLTPIEATFDYDRYKLHSDGSTWMYFTWRFVG